MLLASCLGSKFSFWLCFFFPLVTCCCWVCNLFGRIEVEEPVEPVLGDDSLFIEEEECCPVNYLLTKIGVF